MAFDCEISQINIMQNPKQPLTMKTVMDESNLLLYEFGVDQVGQRKM